MHEVSLAAAILRIVEGAAARNAFERVCTVRLAVPPLAGVEVAALRFALQALAPGTLLDGADVQIDEAAGLVQCRQCDRAVELVDRWQACPHCGAIGLPIGGAGELRVVDLLVE